MTAHRAGAPGRQRARTIQVAARTVCGRGEGRVEHGREAACRWLPPQEDLEALAAIPQPGDADASLVLVRSRLAVAG